MPNIKQKTKSSKAVTLRQKRKRSGKKKNFVSYQEAQKICIANNIDTVQKYAEMYKSLGLPACPNKHYDNWTNWYDFLSKSKDRFLSYQEAVDLCKRLGIKNQSDYKELQLKRHDLPSAPSNQYDEFTNWYEFTGRVKPGSASMSQHKKWLEGKTAEWWMSEGHRQYKDQGASSRPDRIFGKPFSYFTGRSD